MLPWDDRGSRRRRMDNGDMRVIAGRFKGFELKAPKTGTRPTTDRTKEAIFSRLESWGMLEDSRILDMFAGTVVRLGRKLGVATPVNELFYHGIRVLEEKNEGKYSPENT